MRALVTGAAGFIGSSIVDRLLRDGMEVVGVDNFSPYYDRVTKKSNLEFANDHKNFSFHELDIANNPLSSVLDGVTDIFHQAGQPGVRASWGADFHDYVKWNVLGTQQLLEESKKSSTLKSFVAASSSSVYGSAERFPTSETDLPRPISPYGVTKLAAENLCSLYGSQFGLPTASLRYFTVFGPRQRPDMAISRIIMAALQGTQFVVFGDGNTQRDFTFIEDVVEANIRVAGGMAANLQPGIVLNVGGNSTSSLIEIIEKIQLITGTKIPLSFLREENGDPRFTAANIEQIYALTGWNPIADQMMGLESQVKWAETKLTDN